MGQCTHLHNFLLLLVLLLCCCLIAFASSIEILRLLSVSVCTLLPTTVHASAGFPCCGLAGAFASCSCRMGYYMGLLGLLRGLTYAGRGPMPQVTHRSSRVVISSMAALVLGFLLGPLRLHSFATTRVLTALRFVW